MDWGVIKMYRYSFHVVLMSPWYLLQPCLGPSYLWNHNLYDGTKWQIFKKVLHSKIRIKQNNVFNGTPIESFLLCTHIYIFTKYWSSNPIEMSKIPVYYLWIYKTIASFFTWRGTRTMNILFYGPKRSKFVSNEIVLTWCTQ